MGCRVASVCAIGSRAGPSWSKVSWDHSLRLVLGPFDTDAVEKVPAPWKCAKVVKTKPMPVAAKPASPRQLHPIWAKPTMAKEALPEPEMEELLGGNSDWGKAIGKGKDTVGASVKRKSTGDTAGPWVKRPHIESATLNVGELDHMAALLNGMWDKVVVARKVMHTAKGSLHAVEGHLCMMEDWVREMCHRA